MLRLSIINSIVAQACLNRAHGIAEVSHVRLLLVGVRDVIVDVFITEVRNCWGWL